MKKFAVVLVAALLALAFGPALHASAAGKVVRITLIDENGSGEDGSAQLTDQGDGTTKVELIMLNAPDGAVQPAHIHPGSCANLTPKPDYPLESVKEGKSTTIVKVALADLLKEKHAINVHKSAEEVSVYVSCGNLPLGDTDSNAPLTLSQSVAKMLDLAEELAGTVKKKEADASQNAYDLYHAAFAAGEEAIKAKSAETQAGLEDAMHVVRDAVQAGDWDKAGEAADELVSKLKDAQAKLGSDLTDAFATLQKTTADIQREVKNKDAMGSQAAYDAFHEAFAANEEAIKAKNAEAQAHLEEAMHEVRDAIKAADWDKAVSAADELAKEVGDAMGEMGMSTGSTGSTSGPGSTSAGMASALAKMQNATADIKREVTNKDATGAQAAYNEFHDVFAANEDAIKAQNAEAQAHLEEAMHEVRDAIQAGDMSKAAAAADELAKEVGDAMGEMGLKTNTLPTSGNGSVIPALLALAGAALALLSLGGMLRRRAVHH